VTGKRPKRPRDFSQAAKLGCLTCIHQTLRTTPAMAAGVTKRLWEMTDLVDVLEAWEARAIMANQTDPLREIGVL